MLSGAVEWPCVPWLIVSTPVASSACPGKGVFIGYLQTRKVTQLREGGELGWVSQDGVSHEHGAKPRDLHPVA